MAEKIEKIHTGGSQQKESLMPNIVVNIPEGVLDGNSRKALIKGINAVAVDVEQIGEDPKSRFLCWMVIDEIKGGNWTCGGVDVALEFIPILIVIHIPIGVLDDAMRSRYIQGIQSAAHAALPDEGRRILVSCIINEVPDGLWGVNGTVWHLKDFVHHAGYIHLQ